MFYYMVEENTTNKMADNPGFTHEDNIGDKGGGGTDDRPDVIEQLPSTQHLRKRQSLERIIVIRKTSRPRVLIRARR